MSDYNVDTLENKIVVEAQEAINSLKEIIGYVNQSKTAIDSMKSATGLKSLDKQVKTTTSNLTKMQLIGNGLKKALNVSGLIYGAKRAFSFLTDSAEKSIDYIETLNLFEVSMGKTLDQYGNLDSASSKYYTRALKFQRELNERFGTNIEETMRYQALYNQMAESMGINDNASYIISENLTKLGIDLASLFNKSEADTMEALRAGVLAGQTKPLRNYGLDVTQQTLAPLASELGIERSVKQLSQAEKMILRYIAVLRQASSAHGDFAKTIESPANQLKVFKQQFVELKTAIGNLFQGMLGQILPYVNGVLMVIKELIKAIGSLFGFKVSSSSTNLADQTGIEDLNTGLGGAVGSAKELKAQLMGFDEINNITTDTGSSGSGGGVSSTGIDSKLLDAMKDYDNLMSKVKMKATDIRDKIMDWLGFTKVINPLTGEVSWKLREGWTNLKKIWTIIKGLIGLYLTTKVVKLLGSLKNLFTVLKTGKTTGLTPMVSGLKLLKEGLSSTKTWIKVGIDNFKSLKDAGYTTGSALKLTGQGMLDLIPIAGRVVGGLAGLAGSIYGSYDAMRDLSEGTKTADTAFSQLFITIGGATASGALIGSVFGPAGTAVGAVLGGMGAILGAVEGYYGANDTLTQSIKDNSDAIDANKKSLSQLVEESKARLEVIQDTLDQGLAEVDYTQNLANELDALVDSNGRVKDGYEDRVKYILNELNGAYGFELELIDGVIQGYGEYKESIYDLIEAKRAEKILEANEAEYLASLDEKQKYYALELEAIKNQEDAVKNMNDAWEAYDTYVKNVYGSWEALESSSNSFARSQDTNLGKLALQYEETKKKVEEADTAVQNATTKYENCAKKTIAYSNLQEAIITGDTEKIQIASKNLQTAYNETSNSAGLSWKQQIQEGQDYAKLMIEMYEDLGKDITDETQQMAEAQLRTTVSSMRTQVRTVEDLTPDIVEAYKLLGEQQYDIYEEELNKLGPAIKTELQNMTGIIIEKTPEVERVTAELGEKMLDKLDNDSDMKKQAVESVKAYLQGLSEEKQRDLLKQAGIDNADEVIKGLKQGNLAEDVGINIIKGLRTGLQNDYWQGRTLSTAFNFATNVLSRFKSTFGIQSPSKKTKQFGLYLLEGLGIGIKNGEKDILGEISNFSKEILGGFSEPLDFIKNGVSVDQNKLAVDTNQFIDYGAVEGSINSNLNLNSNLSQIPNLIYNAVMQGMKNSNIRVDIKAETEEGVIVKKASQGFKDYVTQTGELPFPIPV